MVMNSITDISWSKGKGLESGLLFFCLNQMYLEGSSVKTAGCVSAFVILMCLDVRSGPLPQTYGYLMVTASFWCASICHLFNLEMNLSYSQAEHMVLCLFWASFSVLSRRKPAVGFWEILSCLHLRLKWRWFLWYANFPVAPFKLLLLHCEILMTSFSLKI